MYKSKCFLCGQIETTFDEDLKGGDQEVKIKLVCSRSGFLNKRQRIIEEEVLLT